jgi:hypothetical protein
LLTGDATASNIVSSLAGNSSSFSSTFDNEAGGYLTDGNMWLASYFMSYIIETNRPTNPSTVQQLKTNLKSTADTGLAYISSSAYPVGWPTNVNVSSHNFNQGGLTPQGQFAYPCLMQWALAGEQKYIDAVSQLMDYDQGLNPIGKCYMTGIGFDRVHHPHQRESAYAEVTKGWGGPQPGITVYGPVEPAQLGNAPGSKQVPPLSGLARERCYVDHLGFWSMNEFTVYQSEVFPAAIYPVLAQGGKWDATKDPFAVTNPVITSSLSCTGYVGVAFTYQITASGSPTNYNATGLPSGLSVNAGSGLISGMPSAVGTSSVSISAMNAYGTNSATLTVIINSTPPGPTGLVGWWKLDESSGTTAADSSGNGNNGTLSGGTWQASGGQIAGALHLNAFDVVNCGAAASLNTPSVTVAFWMKPDSLGNVIPVDKLPTTGSVGYAVKLRDTGTIWFRVGAEGGPALDVYGGSNIYTNGVWTHVACTFNAGTGEMRMYINGVVESHQPTFAVTLNASNTAFRMGSTVEQYAGLLDDVRVYDHALTSNEVVTVMAGGGGGAEVIRFVPAGMSIGSTNCSLAWSAATGATNSFKMYRSTNLVTASWQLIAASIARSGTGTNLWNDTNVFPQAFYRVAVP